MGENQTIVECPVEQTGDIKKKWYLQMICISFVYECREVNFDCSKCPKREETMRHILGREDF